MIQPTSNHLGFNRTDAITHAPAKPQTVAAQSSAEGEERLSRANSQALREALEQSPEIRPEVVERGRKLAVDPNYPPREIIMSLARLMSDSIDPSEQA
jgi:hypothetical protein